MNRENAHIRLCLALNPRIKGYDDPLNTLQLILKHIDIQQYEMYVVSGRNGANLYRHYGFGVLEIPLEPSSPRGLRFVVGYLVFLSLQLLAMIVQIRRTRPHVLISISGHVYSGLVTTITGIIMRIPTVVRISEPTSRIVKMKYGGGSLISALVKAIENWVLLMSSAVVSNRTFHGQYPQKICRRINVISQGVDPTIFKPNLNESQERPPTIVTVARLSEEKNHRAIIQALSIIKKSIPDIHLKIVGTGPLESEIRDYCNRLGLQDNISFLGHVRNQTILSAIVADSDVFVLPSKEEGLSSAVLEAMSCMVPVATNADSGLRSAGFRSSDHYILCGESRSTIAESILQLLQDSEKSMMMAKSAYSHVVAKHTTRICRKKFNYLLMRICQAV